MKHPVTLVILWFGLLWLLFVFATPISEGLWLLDIPIRWGILLAGCVIAILALANRRVTLQRGMVVTAIVLIGCALYFSVGFDSGRYLLFQIRKPGYEKQLAEAKELGQVPRGQGHTEDGPPKLYAFYWYRGVVDNWAGVVYDPSGRIGKINEADGWDEIHAQELSRLFGGTFYRCQDVGGGWYICWFT